MNNWNFVSSLLISNKILWFLFLDFFKLWWVCWIYITFFPTTQQCQLFTNFHKKLDKRRKFPIFITCNLTFPNLKISPKKKFNRKKNLPHHCMLYYIIKEFPSFNVHQTQIICYKKFLLSSFWWSFFFSFFFWLYINK